MKMLLSTAKVLLEELEEKINAAGSATEIELSHVAVALLADTQARAELDQAIDDASGD